MAGSTSRKQPGWAAPVYVTEICGGAMPTIKSDDGEWGYNAGVSGTISLTGGKRVLQITAIALGAAGNVTINGGDTIPLPYEGSDKTSTMITIEPRGNLVDPSITFTNTDAYFVEYVT